MHGEGGCVRLFILTLDLSQFALNPRSRANVLEQVSPYSCIERLLHLTYCAIDPEDVAIVKDGDVANVGDSYKENNG